MKVLIVDDNEDSRVLLQDTLKFEGYSVTCAENGVKAFDEALRSRPDIIISDVLMPEMDGFELCRRVKENEQFSTIPFVFYSATFIDKKDEELATALGASGFISKPMESKQFLSVISDVLKQHQEEKLPTPQRLSQSSAELKRMHTSRVIDKLENKVRELDERSAKLRESEQKYRRLVENLREEYFFYSHGTDGIFTYLSPSVKDVLGYDPIELMRHYTDFLTDNPVNSKAREYTALCIKGEEPPLYEMEILHKDGSAHYLEIKEFPVFNNLDRVISIEGIAHDITGRKRAEQERDHIMHELLQKTDELEQVLYAASHDLRTPLVNIHGFSKELTHSLQKFLARIKTDPSISDSSDDIISMIDTEILEALSFINSGIDKMEKLISGLRMFSRLCREQFTMEPTNMNHLINKVVKNLENRIKELNVKISISDLPDCSCDSQQTYRLFTIILDNALKFREPSRDCIIHISGNLDMDDTVYCVEDNGIGIKQEYIEQIFSIFYRLAPEKTQGDGIGLSIAQRLVEKHHGKIWVESEPEKGSKFFISLPS